MSNFKEVMISVKKDFAGAAANRKMMRFACVILTLTLILSFAAAAFATNTDPTGISEAVENAGQKIWNTLIDISIPVGLVVIVAAGLMLIISHGERDIEKLKKTLVYIIVGYALVFLAPIVLSTIVSMFKGQGSAAWDNLIKN